MHNNEIAANIIGKRIKVKGAPFSFSENYLRGGTFAMEMDVGLIGWGSYAIGQNALCYMLRGDAKPSCSRFYTTPGGAITRVYLGREDQPLPVTIIGPTHLK